MTLAKERVTLADKGEGDVSRQRRRGGVTLADKGGEGDAGCRRQNNAPQMTFVTSPAQVCITP